MSTRWYPFYQRGNPQLRVFLPNFWMKLVETKHPTRKSIVQFHCSMEMTKHDIKNYIEKIYKVPVIRVNTRIAIGAMKKQAYQNYITKDDDIKIAYVQLPRYESFEFPKLFGSGRQEKEEKDQESAMGSTEDAFKKIVEERTGNEPGASTWFL